MERIRIGLIGAGTVGSGVIEILKKESNKYLEKFGIELILSSVCTRTPEKIKKELQSFPNCKLESDYQKLVTDPEIDMILELVGGTDIAYSIVKDALKFGKTVITANKALLSQKGDELFSFAQEKGLEIGIEASVAGAIPVIRSIKSSLGSDSFLSLYGILNGTTNFILSKMELENLDYSEALRIAQDLGFAEKDPTFDVEGIDTAHKISILGSLAFSEKIPLQSVQIEGITKISGLDIRFASELGYRIKLLGLVRKLSHKIEARVQPVMIPIKHPFANIMNEMNAVYYQTAYAGTGMFVGKGAGSLPTASSVVSDILYYGARRNKGIFQEKNIFPQAMISEANVSLVRYYLRFTTVDLPGVLSEISKVLGDHGVSISSVRQNETEKEPVEVVVITHPATEESIKNSLKIIDGLSLIRHTSVAIRLEDKL
ncbi:homoserine dehydrogenase [Leptospira interrogans]|uniref:Homoserine dehydrogenase n=7 Tax=Leptospira interrogans TaxID=173 RepID=A0AAQ1NU58_LEPIR|nr:homoserine dehydrogenase [Leptospira interrogans]APH40551.1 Homoserine dehydrogenase [Leptospira interrogans serovar Copenhageni/Icterohaemorrhagiae]EMG23094.1 homoserine dehydrogenase [Leptospira interrogans serovar Copenhageni str. LT2050]EMN70277.1 homoserine dehydrogenase [Leptospira interrogans serovar Bataviae str. UI 08561]EMO05752.1 homoserine dehydrogenase [Leptospira interrogans serovar Icterohaemorrhagiae str. Verdun HP]OCC30101.1 Homoserine dehydrogenase [Leptospira interrogans 